MAADACSHLSSHPAFHVYIYSITHQITAVYSFCVSSETQCSRSNFPVIFRKTNLCGRRPASSYFYFWPPLYRNFPRNLWLTQRPSSLRWPKGLLRCRPPVAPCSPSCVRQRRGAAALPPAQLPLLAAFPLHPSAPLCSSAPRPPTPSEHPDPIKGRSPEFHRPRACVFSAPCRTCTGSTTA